MHPLRCVLGPRIPHHSGLDERPCRPRPSPGKLDEAEPLIRQVVEAGRRVLGPEHLTTLDSMIESCCRCSCPGASWTRLSRLFARSWKVGVDAFGPEHLTTLTSMFSLAMVLRPGGKLDEAEPVIRQAMEPLPPRPGSEHPTTLTTRTAGRSAPAPGQAARGRAALVPGRGSRLAPPLAPSTSPRRPR